jgi:putative spermidine/putrescine transport system substrate-binding protein
MRRIRKGHVVLAAVAAALCVPAAGVSSSSDNSPITKVGKTEGQLNLIAWEGYTQPQWVNPFTKATGCKVKP